MDEAGKQDDLEVTEETVQETKQNREEAEKTPQEESSVDRSSGDESDMTDQESTADEASGKENKPVSDQQKEALAKAEQLETELEETKERLLRVQADYDNFRKRTKSEREAEAKYRTQPLVEALLPVIDNFERALAVEAESDEAKSILTGIDMVYRQLKEALAEVGVEEIEAEGKPFDPHIHQAVVQEPSDEHDSGTVITVMQKGYQLKDRVIRPAMVKVSE